MPKLSQCEIGFGFQTRTGGRDEKNTFSNVDRGFCFSFRLCGGEFPERRQRRPGKTSFVCGQLSTDPRGFSGRGPTKSWLRVWHFAAGRSLELCRQKRITPRGISAIPAQPTPPL